MLSVAVKCARPLLEDAAVSWMLRRNRANIKRNNKQTAVRTLRVECSYVFHTQFILLSASHENWNNRKKKRGSSLDDSSKRTTKEGCMPRTI